MAELNQIHGNTSTMAYYTDGEDDRGVWLFLDAVGTAACAYLDTTDDSYRTTEPLARMLAFSLCLDSQHRLISRGGDPKNAPCVFADHSYGRTKNGVPTKEGKLR